MKILHVITTINRGGAENHLFDLVRGQVGRGHRVSVAYLKGDGYWRPGFERLGVDVHDLDLRCYGQLTPVKKIMDLLRRGTPDLVHAHMPPAELYTWLALILARDSAKLIVTKHSDADFFSSDQQKRSLPGAIVERWIANRAAKVIAISQAVQRHMTTGWAALPRHKIRVIYHGIETSEHEAITSSRSAEIRRSFGIGPQELLLGTVARLVPLKAVDLLIRSFHTFISQPSSPPAKLLIVGAGPLEAQLKMLSSKLELTDHIIWAGFREDIPDIMRTLDLFVLTSRYEGFGMVLIEAMAAGLPVVASRISAIPEVVADRESGLLFEPDNEGQLVACLMALVESSVRARYGDAGCARVNRLFKLERMVKETLDIYEN